MQNSLEGTPRAAVSQFNKDLAAETVRQYRRAAWSDERLTERISQVLEVAALHVRHELDPLLCEQCDMPIPLDVESERFCCPAHESAFYGEQAIDRAIDEAKDRRAGLLTFALCALSGAVMGGLTCGAIAAGVIG